MQLPSIGTLLLLCEWTGKYMSEYHAQIRLYSFVRCSSILWGRDIFQTSFRESFAGVYNFTNESSPRRLSNEFKIPLKAVAIDTDDTYI